jgi:predicted CXXCH cytochrome family protein
MRCRDAIWGVKMIQFVGLKNLPRHVGFAAVVLACIHAVLLGIGVAAGAATSELTPTRYPARAMPAGNGAMTAAQCAACHVTEPVLSHPVGTKATHVADGFPLENGQITCTTCHLDSVAQHAARNGAMLRGTARGAAFCAACHTDSTMSLQSQHPLAIARAHGGWQSGGPAPAAASTAAADSVKSCLACHDGTIASDAFGRMNWNLARTNPAAINGSNHPVAMAYPKDGFARPDVRLRPAATLDHRVRLIGDQVACTSCHSLYSAQPKLLVMRNDGSALCFSCHAN